MLIRRARAAALEVPLREPFTIATATMTTTRAALIRLDEDGGCSGHGEAACLHPVTHEDLPDVLAAAETACAKIVGHAASTPEACADLAGTLSPEGPVLRAALECALLDALARDHGTSIARLFGQDRLVREHESDITIPIADDDEMMRVGALWHAEGFRAFKAKVGRDVDRESRALCKMHESLPGLRFRLDANAGFSATEALAMLDALRARGARVECFEQPCAREDVEGMAKVVRDGAIDVVADESVRGEADLDAILRLRTATSVNLKIVKLGGFGAALALGRRALAAGLGIMVGGMVETRLGMTCAATLAGCLAEVRYADLDTAWLLADDPFVGGFASRGPHLTLLDTTGFGVGPKPATKERQGFFG